MDNNTGNPNPPLRIMEPNGAPINTNNKHATDKVYFLYTSI